MLVLGLAMGLVPVVWTAPDWLRLLGLDPEILDAGRGYTRAMAVTLVPMLGVMLYRTILTASERPKAFLYVTAAMLPVNALGNAVLMNGWGPIPGFGPTGAGLSTLVVAVTSLGLLAGAAWRSGRKKRGVRVKVGWSDVAGVLRLGVPIGVAAVAELGIFLGATLYAATLGAADVAAHTLTLRVAGVAYAIPAALLQAAMVRTARAEAQADRAQAGRVLAGALGLGVAAGGLLCLGLIAAAHPMAAAFFGPSAAGVQAAGLAVGLLVILGVMDLLATPGQAAAGVLRGRKDTRKPMLYTLAGYWLIGAPLGLWLSEGWQMGITGVWAGLAVGTAATSGLMLRRVLRQPRAEER